MGRRNNFVTNVSRCATIFVARYRVRAGETAGAFSRAAHQVLPEVMNFGVVKSVKRFLLSGKYLILLFRS